MPYDYPVTKPPMQQMSQNTLDKLMCGRLEDMADQVIALYESGRSDEAELLRREGLEMAAALDSGEEFLFSHDLRHVK